MLTFKHKTFKHKTFKHKTFRYTLSFWMFALVGVPTIGLVSFATPVKAQTAPSLVSAAETSNRTLLLVNSAAGNDATADGSDRAPFKTITRALQVAQPNTIVLLSPGVYSAETGEVFPLVLKSGVTLHGNPETRGQGIVIRGSGAFLSKTSARQNVTILGANQSALVGVTVSNPDNAGYGLWIESTRPIVTDNTFTASGHDGISVVGDGAPLIRNNYFYQNGANGITIYGRSRPEVRENIFENTGFGININQFATPLIVGNRITQNKDGIVVQANARPVLRQNSIESNSRDGLVAIAQSQPDLGTAGDPGGNIFRNNGQLDINAEKSSQMIPAAGNEIAKTQGQLDRVGAVSTSLTSTAIVPPVAFSIKAITSAPSSDPAHAASDVSASSFPVPAALNPANSEPIALPPAQATRPNSLAAPKISPPPIALRPVATPIAIPVPPPESRSVLAARPLLLVSRTQVPAAAILVPPPIALSQPAQPIARPQPAAVLIPVPPPESRTIASVAPQPSTVALSPAPAASPLLPVPSIPIPIGNVGSGSGVPLYRNASQRTASNLRYRVVLDRANDSQQAKAQSLVPGAFRTTLKGKMVMQLGAFGDRAKADELLQTLRTQGIQATIEVD